MRITCEQQGGAFVNIQFVPPPEGAMEPAPVSGANPIWRSVIEDYVAAARSGQNLSQATCQLEDLASALFNAAFVSPARAFLSVALGLGREIFSGIINRGGAILPAMAILGRQEVDRLSTVNGYGVNR